MSEMQTLLATRSPQNQLSVLTNSPSAILGFNRCSASVGRGLSLDLATTDIMWGCLIVFFSVAGLENSGNFSPLSNCGEVN